MKKKVSVLLLSAMIIYTMCGYSSNAKIVQNNDAKKEQVENLRVRVNHGLRAVEAYENEVEEATVSDAVLSIEINDCLLLKEPYYPTEVIIAAEENQYELPGVIKSIPYEIYEEEYVPKVNPPMEEHLTKRGGVFYGPSGKEKYYNLNMSGVVTIMRNSGYSSEEYPYWVRADGVKMLGDYVMVAADLSVYPRGSIVETSLGTGLVCDKCVGATYGDTVLDLAVSW